MKFIIIFLACLILAGCASSARSIQAVVGVDRDGNPIFRNIPTERQSLPAQTLVTMADLQAATGAK